ncbi:FAD binding domain-containing protein [Xanthobacter sp. KR7-225]|uniref:FAD binding domain-containing protein n=1 Tax=Xanthobacter sp. KR7-225 TaxID=3156613 RepID=UPI0032B337B9
MKPARFDYVRAEAVAHAAAILADAGGDGKVLAGGQSLMPMVNFRLVKPSVLVDINHVAGLDKITLADGRLSLGALVRHRMTAENALVETHIPVLRHAMKHVAHLTVRNRGTFCGSVCHADPAAEMPMMTLLLDGLIHTASTRANRVIAARDFFVGSLVTALAPDELVTAVTLDTLPEGAGWGFAEFARRHGDYALASVAVVLERHGGVARNVRVATMGVGELPARMDTVAAALEGTAMDDRVLDGAVDLLRAAVSPNSDLNASADYRRHLVGTLARRALADAWARAREAAQ